MPAVSRAQQRLMQAAEHGADFPMARKVRQSMTHDQLHDFASGSEQGKPVHVRSHSGHTEHLQSEMSRITKHRHGHHA